MIYSNHQGLGATTGQIVGSSVTTGLSTAALATGGPTNPVGLALSIAAGVSAIVTGIFGQPDLKKIAATHVVDQLEPYLKQNLQWWATVPHTLANQQQGEAVFNAVWNQVETGCSDPSLGSAGVNCLADRTRGGKWDWFALYFDPIANATLVVDPFVTASIASGDVTSLVENPLFLGLGLVFLGVAMSN